MILAFVTSVSANKAPQPEPEAPHKRAPFSAVSTPATPARAAPNGPK